MEGGGSEPPQDSPQPLFKPPQGSPRAPRLTAIPFTPLGGGGGIPSEPPELFRTPPDFSLEPPKHPRTPPGPLPKPTPFGTPLWVPLWHPQTPSGCPPTGSPSPPLPPPRCCGAPCHRDARPAACRPPPLPSAQPRAAGSTRPCPSHRGRSLPATAACGVGVGFEGRNSGTSPPQSLPNPIRTLRQR